MKMMIDSIKDMVEGISNNCTNLWYKGSYFGTFIWHSWVFTALLIDGFEFLGPIFAMGCYCDY